MITLIGVIGFILAVGSYYILTLADKMYNNIHVYIVVLSGILIFLNLIISPEFIDNNATNFDTDPNWMLVCAVSVAEALIILGCVYGIKLLIYNYQESKKPKRTKKRG